MRVIHLSEDDWAFLVGFDPERDRVANRRDMVSVVEHMQTALSEGLQPGEELHEWRCPSCGATTRARMADH